MGANLAAGRPVAATAPGAATAARPDVSSFTLTRTPLTLLPSGDKDDAGCKMGAC